ncbi:PadR family transcriptional regulator [Candidatus Bathyarchaeota archaeon]|nr:PadR family transcriptional regulator [Candidatus Bathyarchaeota archaeon]MBT4320125.1 PadR family transcriptional regulator [Candidatus Bathyarchaeota archaeon]MBT4424055.1 PadR family transcriptional regulator [Candidatus Bathyarchaeota archaeon]MBT6604642.1 PadR family transcriptional regulator [Candidatus Bathyarchaeota archaeon]MBT7186423.1 PadR family transcriptional regulator [Candidatus Bathyarchaeota archaeon]
MREMGKRRRRHHGPHPERGWVQFLLLMLLNEEPKHGYQLAEELQTRGYVREGRFKTGSLYTILNRMENKEILTSKHEESEAGRPRRVYSITENGREHLKNGLQYMLRRKKFLDEMEEYYRLHFPKHATDGEKENA